MERHSTRRRLQVSGRYLPSLQHRISFCAPQWRRNVTNIDHSANYALFKEFYGSFRKPRTLADAKHIADTLIDLIDEEKAIRFGMALLGVPIDFYDEVIGRWVTGGKRPIGEFAPYFRHMFSVDFFFQLAIAADLISRVRPAGKADNRAIHGMQTTSAKCRERPDWRRTGFRIKSGTLPTYRD